MLSLVTSTGWWVCNGVGGSCWRPPKSLASFWSPYHRAFLFGTCSSGGWVERSCCSFTPTPPRPPHACRTQHVRRCGECGALCSQHVQQRASRVVVVTRGGVAGARCSVCRGVEGGDSERLKVEREELEDCRGNNSQASSSFEPSQPKAKRAVRKRRRRRKNGRAPLDKVWGPWTCTRVTVSSRDWFVRSRGQLSCLFFADRCLVFTLELFVRSPPLSLQLAQVLFREVWRAVTTSLHERNMLLKPQTYDTLGKQEQSGPHWHRCVCTQVWPDQSVTTGGQSVPRRPTSLRQ